MRMAADETMLHCLRGGPRVDPEDIVNTIVADLLPRLDPRDGVRLAISKLQLAVLEALDQVYEAEIDDAEDHLDREWTDEQGLIDFL